MQLDGNGNTITMCENCSKLTIKTPRKCQTSFWGFYNYLLTDFTHCYVVSIVEFEQVNVGWVSFIFMISN